MRAAKPSAPRVDQRDAKSNNRRVFAFTRVNASWLNNTLCIIYSMCTEEGRQWKIGQISASENPLQPSDRGQSLSVSLSLHRPLSFSLIPRTLFCSSFSSRLSSPPSNKTLHTRVRAQKPDGGSDYPDIMRSFAAAAAVYHHISPETPRIPPDNNNNNCDRVTENQYNNTARSLEALKPVCVILHSYHRVSSKYLQSVQYTIHILHVCTQGDHYSTIIYILCVYYIL